MLSVRKSRYGCTREVWRARDTSYQPSSRAALHATDRVFFAPIYGPNRAEKTRLVLTANSYVINQQNFSEVSASCIERRREMDEVRIEWLMTLLLIPEFLTALEINLPNGSFLKDFSCTKLHHLVLVVFTATKNGLFREQ